MVNMSKTAKQLQHQREYRQRTNNKCTAKYEKTPNGFLMRTYRNMESRILGIQWRKAHLYKGKSLLSKELFYEWSKKNQDFWELFNRWTELGYPRRLSPSIDRIDSSRGYELDNIRWITHSENSRLGSIHQWQMKHEIVEALKTGK